DARHAALELGREIGGLRLRGIDAVDALLEQLGEAIVDAGDAAARTHAAGATHPARLRDLGDAADLREYAIDFHLAHGELRLSDSSGRGDIDPGIADARQLVAQRARADAELLGDFPAAAGRGAQCLEDHVALGAFHGLVQRRRSADATDVESCRLLLEQDVFGLD